MRRDCENPARSAMRHLLAPLVLLCLTACANKSYVVLLPDAAGSVGKVVVSNAQGSTQLTQASEGARMGGEPGKTFPVSPEQIAKDFGAALAASPKAPRSFLLYFDMGATLTPESQSALQEILAEIAQRPGADVSVIGHTDTAGEDQANYELGLRRATTVAELMGATGLPRERMSIESHGEKNPMVPTPDNTNEPRNRRVEVTVR